MVLAFLEFCSIDSPYSCTGSNLGHPGYILVHAVCGNMPIRTVQFTTLKQNLLWVMRYMFYCCQTNFLYYPVTNIIAIVPIQQPIMALHFTLLPMYTPICLLFPFSLGTCHMLHYIACLTSSIIAIRVGYALYIQPLIHDVSHAKPFSSDL